jgi:hypothetical protein
MSASATSGRELFSDGRSRAVTPAATAARSARAPRAMNASGSPMPAAMPLSATLP